MEGHSPQAGLQEEGKLTSGVAHTSLDRCLDDGRISQMILWFLVVMIGFGEKGKQNSVAKVK